MVPAGRAVVAGFEFRGSGMRGNGEWVECIFTFVAFVAFSRGLIVVSWLWVVGYDFSGHAQPPVRVVARCNTIRGMHPP